MPRTSKLKISKKAELYDKDTHLWETRQLGASPVYAEEGDLQLLTIRLQPELIEQFKQFAKLEGIGYQPLMRQVLKRYARENEHRLTPKPPKP